MKLKNLLNNIEILNQKNFEDIEITNLHSDSRKINCTRNKL